jgi:FKBP12-rapamycin complex-associated protein
VEGGLYRAMLLVAADDFGEARGVLGKVRALLDTQVGALVGESYERAYKGVVEAQQVAELEEVGTTPPPPSPTFPPTARPTV